MIKEEAIEILSDMRAEYNIFSDDEEEATRYHALSWAIQALNERTGRWIRKANWMWTCSCCGSDNAYAYRADDAYEPTVLQDFFCPNCGARMEEQE